LGSVVWCRIFVEMIVFVLYEGVLSGSNIMDLWGTKMYRLMDRSHIWLVFAHRCRVQTVSDVHPCSGLYQISVGLTWLISMSLSLCYTQVYMDDQAKFCSCLPFTMEYNDVPQRSLC
jgi:hypothetical protein